MSQDFQVFRLHQHASWHYLCMQDVQALRTSNSKAMLKEASRESLRFQQAFTQELETVELEVNDLINQANEGGDMSNIKSAASGPSILNIEVAP